LALVLAWGPLLTLKEAKEALLFGIKVDVLAKLLVDLVPALVLAKGDQSAHFWALSHDSVKTGREVFLHESIIKLRE
jgi:hypothetical protein